GSPVQHRMLERGRAEQQVECLDEAAALVGAVREVAVVARRDAETGGRDVEQEEQNVEGINPEAGDVRSTPDDGDQRSQHQERSGDPVHLLQYAHCFMTSVEEKIRS